MKTILLIRHAKSSWDDFSLQDEQRPLNERGKKNAPEMAHRLFNTGIEIDAFLSSHAVRARTTAEYFAEAYGVPAKNIQIVPALYLAGREAFIDVVRNAPAEANSIAIFSHNNGITEFANTLSDVRIDDMPTCAIFGVQADIRDWNEFETGKNKFLLFDFPKKKK